IGKRDGGRRSSVPPGRTHAFVNTTITLAPGSVIDLAGRALQFGAAARVTIGAGSVQILAGPVSLVARARITGATGVAPSPLEIDSRAASRSKAPAARGVGSTCPARCKGGTITLNASGAITAAADIVSDGNGTEASGGVIMLTSAAGDFIVSGSLSSNGGSDAGGGFISLVAQGGKIDIVQTVDLSGGEFDGGELDLTASGNVIVRQEIAGDQCERRWALRQRRHGLHHRRWHGHATREHRRDRGRLQR